MYYNKAVVIGNITRDPELKSLPSGSAVCSFSVATNRTWKEKSGEKKEAVEFHNIVVFGKQAENVKSFMTKGSQVLVEGRLQTRSWDGQDGKKNYRTEIVADTVQFGNRPAGTTQAPKAKEEKPVETQTADDSGPIEYPEEEINPDDIPF